MKSARARKVGQDRKEEGWGVVLWVKHLTPQSHEAQHNPSVGREDTDTEQEQGQELQTSCSKLYTVQPKVCGHLCDHHPHMCLLNI